MPNTTRALACDHISHAKSLSHYPSSIHLHSMTSALMRFFHMLHRDFSTIIPTCPLGLGRHRKMGNSGSRRQNTGRELSRAARGGGGGPTIRCYQCQGKLQAPPSDRLLASPASPHIATRPLYCSSHSTIRRHLHDDTAWPAGACPLPLLQHNQWCASGICCSEPRRCTQCRCCSQR